MSNHHVSMAVDMHTRNTFVSWMIALLIVILIAGCAGDSPERMMSLSPASASKNARQTSLIKDVSEEHLLRKTVILLQDLGFQIIYADAELGILIGEKPGDFSLFFNENMQDVGVNALTFGHGAKQPGLPYRIGIVTTLKPSSTGSSDYLLRIQVMRIWRAGPHNNIFFARNFEDAGLYQKLFNRLASIRPAD